MKQLPIKTKAILLLPGYVMNWYGTIYKRGTLRMVSDLTMNHEGIHFYQSQDIAETLHVPMWLAYTIFYILYFIEWLLKCVCSLFTLFKVRAYKSISFEQEAYNNQNNFTYQDTRKRNNWTKNIFKIVWKNS